MEVTGSGAHESADDEQTSGQELDGNQAQAQVDGSVTAAHLSSHGSERAGQDVDGSAWSERPRWQRPWRTYLNFSLMLPLNMMKATRTARNIAVTEGELIECHVDALGLVNQTGAHVDNDEYQEREQCETIRFFVCSGYCPYRVPPFFFQSLLIGSWDCLLCFYTIKVGLPLSSIVKYTIIVNGLLMLFFL